MAADTLPAFPVYELKGSVPLERFEVIANKVAQKLAFVIHRTRSSNPAAVQPLVGFLSSYLGDTARQKLARISTGASYNSSLSGSEHAIRKYTLHLIHLLASQQQPLPATLLVDLAVSYSPQNSSILCEIFRNVLSIPTQAAEFTSSVISAFTAALLPKHPDVIELREVAHALLCITRCGEEAVGLFAQESSFIKALAECYQTLLPKLANSLGGIRPRGKNSTYEITWVETKADLLDCYDTIIRTLAKSPKNVERALEIVFQVFEVPHKASTSSVVFFETSLNDDLNRVAGLDSLFKDVVPPDDARLEVMNAQLGPITSSTDLGVFALLPTRTPEPPVATARVDKGKGKETAPLPAPDPALDALVAQVLDILPDQDALSVRAALQLARFNRSAEALISALLEGEQLPPPQAEPSAAPPKISALPERRNIFDDDEMDYSRLRIGKKRSENADTIFRDKAFIAAQKADILRRAAEVSDPDEEWKSDEEKRPAVVAFFDDDDGEYGGGGVVNDGEGSSESGSDAEDGEDAGPEAALELVWLEDPQAFERDALTRRSATRQKLKTQTGWSDEQIEGWKYMLDRDPRRQAKIREKHEFKGNQPTLTPAPQWDAPRGGRGRGGRGRGGRGGGGRGGGQGGGGEGSSSGGGGDPARDRAYKDKNKARQGNHDRKRGHDKKMARGGLAG
ncbi:hypothetical protein FRC06_001869 [Ceratobasidium sp. 370]|nr:hypothetical protein FRC06_001869 [Ceratobasidium sp. 370]